ncbi:MAG TPA: peptide-methionine (S)-S-oxide reductase, partial [Polyangia bacterium]
MLHSNKLGRALALAAPVAALTAVGLLASCARAGAHDAVALPAPAVDIPRAAKPGAGKQTVVFAGGCFWGVQAVFQHVKGVVDATSGYAGGAADTAKYPLVSTGETGHAESVRVTFDPSQVTFGQLLKVFFSVAHDPTEL